MISIPTTTTTKIPELYPENLTTLLEIMSRVEDLSNINGVFEIEIRVRVDDVETWAVIGWGESGDPCVLRFETPSAKPSPTQIVPRGGFISTDPLNPPYTINATSQD